MTKLLILIGLATMLVAPAYAQTIIKQTDANPLQSTLSNNVTKTNKLLTGSTQTTSAGSNVVLDSYTVGAGNVLYLQSVSMLGMIKGVTLTAATDLGDVSLESPAGTKLITAHASAYQGKGDLLKFEFSEPVPIPAGQLIRIVVDPASGVQTINWYGNMDGFER